MLGDHILCLCRRKMNQYTEPTISAPPMMLPMVTGNRFFIKKAVHVRLAKSAGDFSIRVQKSAEAKSLIKSPIGMKYMFAILCSNPAATNAVIGNRMDRTLSVVLRAE